MTYNVDSLLKQNYDVDNILLLHPTVIEQEVAKLERKCPIYLLQINGEMQNVLIGTDKYFKHIGKNIYKNVYYNIPDSILIFVGDLNGKYYVKHNGTLYDEILGEIDLGYKVIQRDNGKILINGSKLYYLGRNLVQIDDYFINANNIMYHNGNVIVFGESGCFMEDIAVKQGLGYDHHYALYDKDGNILAVDSEALGIDYDKMVEMAFNFPKLSDIDLPKNTILYEHLIIDTLKNDLKYKYELSDCQANTLIEMAEYLQSKELELAIDLDTLKIFIFDYTKYFNNNDINSMLQNQTNIYQQEQRLPVQTKKLIPPRNTGSK